MADNLVPFPSQHIEAVARVLGDTNDGLTGPEIGFILRDAEIPDVDSTNTKWKRLYNALASIQNEKGIGNTSSWSSTVPWRRSDTRVRQRCLSSDASD
jgi:hypothetical protein